VSASILRHFRQPLIWLAVVAIALLGLLALESGGSSHPARILPITNVGNTTSGNPSNGSTQHCTNGLGQDNPKNKHCRAASSG
jgi:hypothetical protein